MKVGVTKYEKYLLRDPLSYDPLGPALRVDGRKLQNFPIELTVLGIHDGDLFLVPPAHTHNYDEIFFFLGSNPRNFFDTDFKAEISLGEKGEKLTIDGPAVLYVPKGLVHCPLVFKEVNKPIFYGRIYMAPVLERASGGREDVEKIMRGEWVVRPYTAEEIAKLKAGILIPHGPRL